MRLIFAFGVLLVSAAWAADATLPIHPFTGRYSSHFLQGCAPADSELTVICNDEICRNASFTLGTFACHPKEGPNQGWIAGDMEVKSGIGLAVGAKDDPKCNLVFVFHQQPSMRFPESVEVRHFGDCNVGRGAEPDRTFTRGRETRQTP